jgi:hypothetical protein
MRMALISMLVLWTLMAATGFTALAVAASADDPVLIADAKIKLPKGIDVDIDIDDDDDDWYKNPVVIVAGAVALVAIVALATRGRR